MTRPQKGANDPVNPIRRVRQWWCGRLHDKCIRFHSWRIVDDFGTIECRRCRVQRGGRQSWMRDDEEARRYGATMRATLAAEDPDLFR